MCYVCCVCCVLCAGAAKLLGSLQEFKVKYAEARAKEHPELQAVYTEKVAAMKKAGGAARGGRGKGTGCQQAASPVSVGRASFQQRLLPPVGVWLCQVELCTLLRWGGWRGVPGQASHTHMHNSCVFLP